MGVLPGAIQASANEKDYVDHGVNKTSLGFTTRHQKPDGHQRKQVIEVGVPPPKNTKQVSSTIQSIYLFFSFHLRLACLRLTHSSTQCEVSK